jgi:hypothetical protein
MVTVLDLGAYHLLIRILRDDEKNEVNWVGYFGGLDGRIAEGFAFEAVLECGKPVLRKVKDGRIRLYTEFIRFRVLGHFRWRRRNDPQELYHRDSDSVWIPCIPLGSVRKEHLFEEPPFDTIRRKIAVLRPKLQRNGPVIAVSYKNEPAT